MSKLLLQHITFNCYNVFDKPSNNGILWLLQALEMRPNLGGGRVLRFVVQNLSVLKLFRFGFGIKKQLNIKNGSAKSIRFSWHWLSVKGIKLENLNLKEWIRSLLLGVVKQKWRIWISEVGGWGSNLVSQANLVAPLPLKASAFPLQNISYVEHVHIISQ